jgi:hypothetical protein
MKMMKKNKKAKFSIPEITLQHRPKRSQPHLAAEVHSTHPDIADELTRKLLNPQLKNQACGLGKRKHKNPPDELNPKSKKFNPRKYARANPAWDESVHSFPLAQ